MQLILSSKSIRQFLRVCLVSGGVGVFLGWGFDVFLGKSAFEKLQPESALRYRCLVGDGYIATAGGAVKTEAGMMVWLSNYFGAAYLVLTIDAEFESNKTETNLDTSFPSQFRQVTDNAGPWMISRSIVNGKSLVRVHDMRQGQVIHEIDDPALKQGVLAYDHRSSQLFVAASNVETKSESELDYPATLSNLRTYQISERTFSRPIRIPANRDLISFERTDKPGFWFLIRALSGQCDVGQFDETTNEIRPVKSFHRKVPVTTQVEPLGDAQSAILFDSLNGRLSIVDIDTDQEYVLDEELRSGWNRHARAHPNPELEPTSYMCSAGRIFIPNVSHRPAFVSAMSLMETSSSGRFLAVAAKREGSRLNVNKTYDVRIFDLHQRRRVCTLSNFHYYAAPIMFVDDDWLVVTEERDYDDIAGISEDARRGGRMRQPGVMTIWDLQKAINPMKGQQESTSAH